MSVTMRDSEVNGVSVVELDGRIVLGEESNSLREKLKSLIAAGKRKIVLNMANVRYIDSAGLNLMLRVQHYAQRQGVTLRLEGVPPAVENALRIAQLPPVLLEQAA